MATDPKSLPSPRSPNVPPSTASPAQRALNAAQQLLHEKNDEPEPIPFDIVGFTFWLRQAALLVAVIAAGVAFFSARISERTWIECVFCSCAAAMVAGAVGTFFARVVLLQLSPTKPSDAKPSGAKT